MTSAERLYNLLVDLKGTVKQNDKFIGCAHPTITLNKTLCGTTIARLVYENENTCLLSLVTSNLINEIIREITNSINVSTEVMNYSILNDLRDVEARKGNGFDFSITVTFYAIIGLGNNRVPVQEFLVHTNFCRFSFCFLG